VECWLKALRINPLFDDAWFVCGCAALHCENWKVALESFARCTAIDYENAEAWNNMATVHIRESRKPEAFQALKEGLRWKHDSWKMWTNFMYLAVDLGHLDEAMLAMTRIMEIRNENGSNKDSVDVEVLQTLIDRILRVHQESPSEARLARLATLVSQATDSISTHRRDVWLAAARFYFLTKNPKAALDAHIRAYRCWSLDSFADQSQFSLAVQGVQELCDAYQNLGSQPVDDCSMVCSDWQYQSLLVARGLLGRGKDFEGTAEYDTLYDLVQELRSISR
jgi:tetratricopeptide (TPR) repeat protein